jgi:hypothetical protein
VRCALPSVTSGPGPPEIDLSDLARVCRTRMAAWSNGRAVERRTATGGAVERRHGDRRRGRTAAPAAGGPVEGGGDRQPSDRRPRRPVGPALAERRSGERGAPWASNWGPGRRGWARATGGPGGPRERGPGRAGPGESGGHGERRNEASWRRLGDDHAGGSPNETLEQLLKRLGVSSVPNDPGDGRAGRNLAQGATAPAPAASARNGDAARGPDR